MCVSESIGCFANFLSENELQQHLLTIHRRKGTPESREQMHLGKNGVGRFWCGFCQEIISQETRSAFDQREMRMQHIGDHYDKKDRSVGDYVSLQSPNASES